MLAVGLQDDPKYRAGLAIRKPAARLRHFLNACAHKRWDDAGGALGVLCGSCSVAAVVKSKPAVLVELRRGMTAAPPALHVSYVAVRKGGTGRLARLLA